MLHVVYHCTRYIGRNVTSPFVLRTCPSLMSDLSAQKHPIKPSIHRLNGIHVRELD